MQIPEDGVEAVKKLLLQFDLPVTEPVKIHSEEMIASVFGDNYEYDFPKWCKQNDLRCFHLTTTNSYLIFPKHYQQV